MLVFTAISFRTIVPRAVWSCVAILAMHGHSSASQGGSIFLDDGDAGAVLLTDQARTPAARVVVEALTPAAPARQIGRHAATTPRAGSLFTEIVNQAARTQRIAPELLHAVIAVESGHTVRAVSPRGAQGLMQLMPATARAYGVTDPFDPKQNITAGAQHLRHLLDQFGQDTALALAAYNAGAGAVVRHRNRIPPFAETASYVPRVMRHFSQLQAASVESIPPRH
jgi:soluble lytic murein transglycosylase-like protein